ncbi:MAG: CopG family transcriptional regulator [Deltaproteobacteria bacterium]|nr:CopG family transcriptional regulator [Deltaproteobacteria bacterium]MBW1738763.1 CopG family transcriptional regulator [Deltaproteobacteria bacterium]MBW1910876.1 CopG family transcriptional regulator [Deltaproteobacteria bacterium]MBW2035121.1 CopG family transcriptional regulator [Deltaproteobacteria bacterium]MBW2115970.1 CopG family transcriptional regulator [Deltaproteobacteria bacterium]
MANLKRKQVYLDEESDRALKSLAFTTKISEAEHIRRAVRKYIAKLKSGVGDDDPLKELIGLCDSPDGPTDASIHHDTCLYGKQV